MTHCTQQELSDEKIHEKKKQDGNCQKIVNPHPLVTSARALAS